MYTIEDFNKAKQFLGEHGYGIGTNFTLNAVAGLMAEWAEKNRSVSAVIKSLPTGDEIWIKANETSKDNFEDWFDNLTGNIY